MRQASHEILRCAQARDQFYQCVREQAGLEFTPETPVPSKCKKLRAAFDKACPASWVRVCHASVPEAAWRC